MSDEEKWQKNTRQLLRTFHKEDCGTNLPDVSGDGRRKQMTMLARC